MRSFVSCMAFVLGVAAAVAPIALHAQSTYTYSIYVDGDARSTTGCGESGASGAETRLDVTVAGGVSPQVLSTTRFRCTSGVFANDGAPSDSAAIGTNIGVAGSDVIEVADRLSQLGEQGSPSLIFAVVARSATGSDTLNAASGGGPMGIGLPALPIPLLGIPALLLLIGLFMLLGARGARRRRLRQLLSLVLLGSGAAIAANFVVDGAIGDWAGTSPLATDPIGDTTSGETAIDLAAFHAALENGKVFFRLDVVNLQNNPPVANAGIATTLEDQPVTITLTGSDTENDTLTFSIAGAPTLGTLGAITSTGPATATVVYTPNADANGTDSFTFVANDGQATSTAAAVALTVTPVNDAPSFTSGPNQTVLEDAAAQSIANWATAISPGPPDESSQAVTFTATSSNTALFSTQPAVASNGTLTYMPAANANGVATISVIAQDNGGTANGGVNTSAAQTFTITVTAVNDAPSFTRGPDQTVLEDAAAQTVAGWATAISPGPPDESGQTVTFAATSSNPALFSAQPAIASNGTLTYTPAANANGVATISVTAQDSGGTANGGVNTSAAQTFTITITAVNDAPSFVKGPDQTVLEDAAAQSIANWATAISAGPPDESSQTVTFTVGNSNAALFTTAPAVSSSGTLTYALAANANGVATVTISAQDNGGTANGGVNTSAAQTFTITVTAVNDAPSFTRGPDQTVLEDAAAQTVAGWATAISPGPPDESGQTVTFAATSSNPALFSAQPAIASNGTLTYTPAANANGVATISVTAQDSGGTANGGVNTSAAQTFTITITAVDDPPVAVNDAATVIEDSGANAIDVLANDTDIDAGPKSIASVTQPVNGVVVITGGGTGLTYAPNPNYCNAPPGTTPDTFTYALTPGGSSATVSVSVTCVDDPPVAVNDSATVAEDAPATAIDVLANDTDIDGGPRAIASVVQPANGAVVITGGGTGLTYQPSADYCNAPPGTTPDTFTYTLTPGSSSATVNVTVTCVNDAPVIDLNGPGAGTGFAATYTEGDPAVAIVDTAALTVVDVDNTSLASASVVIGNLQDGAAEVLAATTSGTSISASYSAGTLTLTGSDSVVNYRTVLRTVTYRNTSTAPTGSPARLVNFSVNDGALNSAIATSTVTVVSVDTVPSFTAGPGQTVLEDAGAQTVVNWATAINDNDGGLQTLSFNVTQTSGSLTFASAPAISATGTLAYTTAPDANGSATFNVVLTDSGASNNQSAPQTLTITATAVNDAPSFVKGANQTVLEDAGTQTVAGWATAISAGPANESSQTVTFSITGNSNPALFSAPPGVAGNGTLTYTPAANANGVATLTIVAVDDGGTANGGINTSTAQTFTITVTAVNDAPSFVKGSDQTVFDNAGAQTVNPWATAVSAGPPNESGQTLAFEIVSNSAPTAFSAGPAISPSGVLTYTPAVVPAGTTTATIVIRLRDNGGTANGGVDVSTDQSFNIAITHVNVAPTLTNNPISYATAGNTQLQVAGAVLAGVARITDASSALAKSVPVDGDGPDAPTVVPASGTSVNGGSYSIAANGAFSYVPPAGYTGTDSFTYQVTDGSTPTPGTVTGTINIAVSQMVWYVRNLIDADNPSGGTGRSDNAFETLAQAQTPSGNNHIIFVFRGNTGTAPLTSNIALKNGQKLWGEGIGLALPTFGTLVPAGTRPAVVNTGTADSVSVIANTVNGARSDVEIRGLQITTDGVARAIFVESANAANLGVSVNDNDLRTSAVTSAALRISAGSTGLQTISIGNNAFQGIGRAINATRSAGTLTVSGFTNNTVASAGTGAPAIAFTGPGVVFDADPVASGYQTVAGGTTTLGAIGTPLAGGGLLLSSVGGDLSFTDLDIHTAAGAALSVTGTGAVNTGAGTGTRVSVGSGVSTLAAVGGPVIDLRQMTANLPFLSLTASGSASNSARIDQLSGNLSAGSTSSIGSVTAAAGTTLHITSSPATISLSGPISATTGSGVVLTGNSGGTIDLPGQLNLSTGTNPAFQATGGGTITANNSANTATTTTATAINIANTAIGSGHVLFRSVSANGAAKGIIVSNTGALGGFRVTGTGSAGTGGTIQNISTRGGEFIDTVGLQLSNMNFSNANTTTAGPCDDVSTTACNAAIYLNNVVGAAFAGLSVSTTAQQGINGVGVSNFTLSSNSTLTNCGTSGSVETACIKMRGLSGTSSISDSNLSFPGADVVEIVNTGSQTLTLNVNNSTFRDSQSSGTGNTGLQVRSEGSANTVVNVTGSEFLRIRTVGLHATAIGTASNDVDVTTSTFDPGTGTMIGIGLDADNGATMRFNVVNNPVIHSRNGPAINVFGDTSATINGRITNNPSVRVLNNVGSNVGSGIRSNINKNAVANLLVQNNVVNIGSDDSGIDLSAIGKTVANPGGATATLNASVLDNMVTIGATSAYGILIIGASNVGDTNALCTNVLGNGVTRNPSSIASFRARVPGAAGFFRMQGFTTTAEAAWNARSNTPTSSGGSEVSFGGAGTFAACTAVLPTNPTLNQEHPDG